MTTGTRTIGAGQARRRLVAELRVESCLFALVAAVSVSLIGIVSGAVWWWQFMLAATAVLTVAFVCRALLAREAMDAAPQRRHGLRVLRAALPSATALVVLLLLVTGLAAPRTAVLGVVPTAATFARFAQLVEAAGKSVYDQSVPTDPLPEFLFLLTAAGGLLAWLSDLLATVARVPALVGVLVAGAVIVPAVLLHGLSPIAIALCLVCYYLLLRETERAARRTGGEVGTSLFLGAGVLVVALVIGTTAPAFAPGGTTPSVAGVTFGEGVSPLVDIGADLRRPLPVTVITYSTTSSSPGYLQMLTLTEFSGTVWHHVLDTSSYFSDHDALPRAPGLGHGVSTTKTVTRVRVQNLTSQYLPTPYAPTSVSGLKGTWSVDPDDLSIQGYTELTAHQSYTIDSSTVTPTVRQLESAGTDYPASVVSELQQAPGAPSIIAATARRVTARAETPFAKALALQDYFRDSGGFRYSVTAPKTKGYDGDTPEVIAAFLKEKAGYCVHFATAMALMARDLGIPSRIAIGYLPGTETGASGSRTTYAVSSDDLHAWPELYFPGIGWVPFEPTVSRGTPVYEQTAASATSTPSPLIGVSTPAPTSVHDLRLDTSTAEPGTSTVATPMPGSAGGMTVFALLLVVLAALAAPCVLRLRQRSLRLRELREGGAHPSVAWAELCASALDLGFAAPATETPRGFAVRVDAVCRASAPGESVRASGDRKDAIEALARLLDAVERERFGPDHALWADPALADDVTTVVRVLARTAGAVRRMRALFVPASLLQAGLRATRISR